MGVFLNFILITELKIKKENFNGGEKDEIFKEISPWIENRWIKTKLYNFYEDDKYWIYVIKDEILKEHLYNFLIEQFSIFNIHQQWIHETKNLEKLKGLSLNEIKELTNIDINDKIFDPLYIRFDSEEHFGVGYHNRWKPVEISYINYLHCGKYIDDEESNGEILDYFESIIKITTKNPLSDALKVKLW